MLNFDRAQASFNKAENFYNTQKIDDAASEYMKLIENAEPNIFSGLSYYRLAQIANNHMHDADTAYGLYYKALGMLPSLCKNLLQENNPNHDYVFRGLKDERTLDKCPLCGEEGQPYWCYPLFIAAGFNAQFNPIRLWMRCESCNHLFSKYYPDKLFLYNDEPRQPNPSYFSMYSNILTKLRDYTEGTRLFEVGTGAGECLLVAEEMGFYAVGIDVIERHVNAIKDRFDLRAETSDFLEYASSDLWDIIIMGDVLEHVSDPVKAIEKAYEILNDTGVLWISTPNFESAFARVVGHNDPMRMQTFHLNYFSRSSLFKLLLDKGFELVDYHVSSHYNGSMEVISRKKSQ